MEQAMRLNPRFPPIYSFQLGWAYGLMGRYPETITALKEFLSRNPNYFAAYRILAASYVQQWTSQQSADAQTLTQALAAAQRAVALNDSFSFGHALVGYVYLWQKRYDQAVAELERAVVLAPNEAYNYAILAAVLNQAGRLEDALRAAEQAQRLQSSGPLDHHLAFIGSVYSLAGRPEEAIAPLKQYLSRYPNFLGAHLTLAAVYSDLGKEAEARAEAAEVLRINPKFSLEVHRQRVPIKDPAMLERHIAALRKAGLK
ncbi:MAG: tetratricopeptide repeat protein [Deltaproteobacteria bacterium]|nr:tetratricopeptide repeat protein [Deltaproteobacteria bacterium]